MHSYRTDTMDAIIEMKKLWQRLFLEYLDMDSPTDDLTTTLQEIQDRIEPTIKTVQRDIEQSSSNTRRTQ